MAQVSVFLAFCPRCCYSIMQLYMWQRSLSISILFAEDTDKKTTTLGKIKDVDINNNNDKINKDTSTTKKMLMTATALLVRIILAVMLTLVTMIVVTMTLLVMITQRIRMQYMCN